MRQLGWAVHGADVGFDNLEEDVRRRFWDIHQRTKDRYEANRPAEERETDRNDDPGL